MINAARQKIILINVGGYKEINSFSRFYMEQLNMPLGILYLSSYLDSHGYKVRLLDTRLKYKSDFLDILHRELGDTMLVGLSVMTPCVGHALEISKFIKEKDGSVKIVWGGVHVTLFPESTVHNQYIDFAIVKEGETGILGLAEYLLGKGRKISEVPNLVFKQNNNVLENKVDIEDGPGLIVTSKYELLEIDEYVPKLDSLGHIKRQADMITSRGCPHQCAFCINNIAYKKKWRPEPLEETLKNLDYLIQSQRIEHIFFMDDDFFCERNRTKRLIGEIAKRGITWESNCRADYISEDYMDDDFLFRLKKSGCIKLRLGLESGSQRILDLLKKEITVKNSINAVEKLTKHGILPSVSFMVGIPTEAKDDVMKTLELILKLLNKNPKIEILGPLIFRPYPGSDLFNLCQEQGLVMPESLTEWSDFYIHNNLLEEYEHGIPWFPYTYILKRVWMVPLYLNLKVKSRILKRIIQLLVRSHIRTKLKFIEFDYCVYRFTQKILVGLNKRLFLYRTSG